jgi:hypothetical protein
MNVKKILMLAAVFISINLPAFAVTTSSGYAFPQSKNYISHFSASTRGGGESESLTLGQLYQKYESFKEETTQSFSNWFWNLDSLAAIVGILIILAILWFSLEYF